MDDAVQVCCPKCKAKFRDAARRLQSGYSRQCPSCESVLFFEEGHPNKNITTALNKARRLRLHLNQLENERPVYQGPATQSVPRRYLDLRQT